MWFRNFGLLSFGEEAEEDEAETVSFVQKNATKSKSMHDVVDDPKLSKQTATIEKRGSDSGRIEEDAGEEVDEEERKERNDRIRNKLHGASKSDKNDKKRPHEAQSSKGDQQMKNDSDSDSDYLDELDKEKKMKRQKKA